MGGVVKKGDILGKRGFKKLEKLATSFVGLGHLVVPSYNGSKLEFYHLASLCCTIALYDKRKLAGLHFCFCMVRSAFALMLQKVTRQESFRLGAIQK